MTSGSRKTLLIGLGVTLTAAAAIAAFVWLGRGPRGVPADKGEASRDENAAAVDAKTYREVVSAFYTGVAALDADANDTAKSELTRATQLAPQEPAAWLDLGLTAIRMAEYEDAERALARAAELIPRNAAPDRLLGLLESRRGRTAEAIGHFRRAVEKDPDDIRSTFALAEEIERQGGEGSEAEVRRLVAEVLKRRPDNVALLMQQARLAVKVGDAETLRSVVARLAPRSESWPDRTRQQFRQVEQSAAAADLRQAAPRVTVLRNLLIAEPSFRASLAEVESPVGVVGEPIETFLKLPSPAPAPSPPDSELGFEVKPFEGFGGAAAAVVAVPPVQEDKPLVVAADAAQVRLSNGAASLAFPGGTPPVPPGPDGLLAVDWNSDAAVDLVCAGAGGLRIYKKEADGSFADVTDATKLGPDVTAAPAVAAWAADVELDGDLDLVLGPQAGPPTVLRNNGDGTFAPIQPFESVAAPRRFAWCDLDGDGLPDVSFLDEKGLLHVFVNQRSGRYGRRAVPQSPGGLRALTAGDQNGDGTLDLLLLRADGAVVRLSADGAAWRSAEVARWEGLPTAEVRLRLAELDNNGALDLVGTSGEGSRIWLGDGSERLQAVAESVGLRVSSVLDLNGDGRSDLAGLSGSGEVAHALNRGSKSYHWQALRPRAAKVVGDGRINSFGLGGEIEVRSGLLVQKQIVSGPTVYFGLGDHADVNVARIVWPNGTVQAEFGPKVDHVLMAEQRLKGSCPFVYTYDGEAVRFVTDFLWRSPLGLRINAQDTAGIAQTEDWIKIRGDQLVPRDGYYDIRLTAELWETHFWDHVSLVAVEHPAGTEVFVDERFARTPPALKVHVTGPLHAVAARDDVDRDVTDVVREADGRYLDTFPLGPYQGIACEHWIEVEIGDDAPRDKPLRLIAQGWVHPTDSSINVALAQGGHGPPQGLVLEVPSSDGGWTVARPDLGFPAGKNKTVVIDLDGLFPSDRPRRLRLRTNLEVFWDRLAVAVAADESQLRLERITAETAELRHRGYSLMTQAGAGSPELPDYGTVTGTAQRWRDLEGFYTRFGDVRELLRETDDRYVIANAGDEVAFRFPALPSPPGGWVRDFVLVGDGWNKDGDFNTAFSGTVHPLPSHDSTSYDAPPGGLEDDPVYRRHAADWEAYHTRYVGTENFRRGLRPRVAR
jgi:cytochrome c-type biogenesis protein CcmH/NrfG